MIHFRKSLKHCQLSSQCIYLFTEIFMLNVLIVCWPIATHVLLLYPQIWSSCSSPMVLWQNMTWQLLYLPAALSAEHRYAADDGKVECVVTYLTSTQRQQKEDSHDIFCLTVKDIS